jgi:hypothetical protein
VRRHAAFGAVLLVLTCAAGSLLGLELRARVWRQALEHTLAHCARMEGAERSCCLAAMRER